MAVAGRRESRQALVRGLDGRTLCLQLEAEAGEVTVETLKLCIQRVTGIPSPLQRLVSCGRELSDQGLLRSSDECLPSCTLLLPLVGGKGGFGSLLRGAATKAGQKKTTNYDACRDMSGRRLRHVNAEKKLKEWIHEAKDRELEKAGEEFIRRLAKEKKQTQEEIISLDEFREQTAEASERVSEAVAAGLKESIKLGKRPAAFSDETDLSKRSKLFAMLEDFSDDDEDEDEDEESDLEEAGEGGPANADANVHPIPLNESQAGEERSESHPNPADTTPARASDADEKSEICVASGSPSSSSPEHSTPNGSGKAIKE